MRRSEDNPCGHTRLGVAVGNLHFVHQSNYPRVVLYKAYRLIRRTIALVKSSIRMPNQ